MALSAIVATLIGFSFMSLILKKSQKYFILRQAAYKGTTYFLAALVNDDESNFTNEFVFLEKVDENDKFYLKEVTDTDILNILAQNIKLD